MEIADRQLFRIAGLEKNYPNSIQIDVILQENSLYLHVNRGKEFIVKG
ncbi:MAG: hypothetical protein PF518_01500 [Spirochaetaceae bacterium]|jgi:hypothetical protein|nr:hypothetical protein [Spirochaetaceae bacterium]